MKSSSSATATSLGRQGSEASGFKRFGLQIQDDLALVSGLVKYGNQRREQESVMGGAATMYSAGALVTVMLCC